MADLKVDFNVDDCRLNDLAAFIRRIEPALGEVDARDACRIDCSGSNYLGPSAAVLLASTLLCARKRNRQCNISLPTEPAALAGFCHFSGLSALVDIARGHEGHLILLSRQSSAQVFPREREPRIQRHGTDFPGTAVLLSLRVEASEDEHDSDGC